MIEVALRRSFIHAIEGHHPLFGPCAPDMLTAYVSVFSHDFKRFDRFTKLATRSTAQGQTTTGITRRPRPETPVIRD